MNELDNHDDVEIIFGFVSPVGTEDEKVIDLLKKKLDDYNYESVTIKLSDYLKKAELNTPFLDGNEYERINSLMNRGNELRKKFQSGQILSNIAILNIQNYRYKKNNNKNKPLKRHAYIIKSLKHPDEVNLLRKIYGKSFWLISVYSPENTRKTYLSNKIQESKYESTNFDSEADFLIKRDQEEGYTYGQSVRKTFPLGDVFINADIDILETSLHRFVRLVFGFPYHTPTIDEYGMYLAQASALMSSSIARQVGAAIMDKHGGVIATGTNEAPYYQGGVCSEDFGNNNREYAVGFDSNTKHKKNILGNLLRLMQDEKWITKKENEKVPQLVDEFLSNPNLKNAKIMNVTEFGREVHAEMTSLMEASRKSISVENCSLYCTTFPCHVCAKHIVTAGLEKVVFVEPYPKSMAEELFRDSISVDKKSDGEDKIEFNPFVGIAPRRYMDVFKWNDRKQENDEKIDWDQSIKQPRFGDNPIAISTNEENQTMIFSEKSKRLTKSENENKL